MPKILTAKPVTKNGVAPKRPRRHHRTNYDKSAGKPSSLTYAPHDPKAAHCLAVLELARCLPRVAVSDAAAHSIVDEYLSLHPTSFPRFKDAQGEVRLGLMAATCDEFGHPFTHAITLRLDPFDREFLGNAIKLKHGQGRHIASTFLHKRLGHAYRRAGFDLRYVYVLETHRDYEEDDDGRRSWRRSSCLGAHVTLLLSIPSPIYDKVVRAISKRFNTPLAELTRRNSGRQAFMTEISSNKAFTRGNDATGRSGATGAIDYAAKGLRQLFDEHRYIAEHATSDFDWLGCKDFGADQATRRQAEQLYDELRDWMKGKGLGRPSAPRPGDADAVRRIFAAEPTMKRHPAITGLACPTTIPTPPPPTTPVPRSRA